VNGAIFAIVGAVTRLINPNQVAKMDWLLLAVIIGMTVPFVFVRVHLWTQHVRCIRRPGHSEKRNKEDQFPHHWKTFS
jgi:hypothetical protein